LYTFKRPSFEISNDEIKTKKSHRQKVAAEGKYFRFINNSSSESNN